MSCEYSETLFCAFYAWTDWEAKAKLCDISKNMKKTII